MSSIIRGQTIARYGNDHRYQTLAGGTLSFYTLSEAEQTRQRWGWEPVAPDDYRGYRSLAEHA
ncbi:MAG: hypothetical protein ABEN55_15020, partial [Bradymonadaceae bacterium]